MSQLEFEGMQDEAVLVRFQIRLDRFMPREKALLLWGELYSKEAYSSRPALRAAMERAQREWVALRANKKYFDSDTTTEELIEVFRRTRYFLQEEMLKQRSTFGF